MLQMPQYNISIPAAKGIDGTVALDAYKNSRKEQQEKLLADMQNKMQLVARDEKFMASLQEQLSYIDPNDPNASAEAAQLIKNFTDGLIKRGFSEKEAAFIGTRALQQGWTEPKKIAEYQRRKGLTPQQKPDEMLEFNRETGQATFRDKDGNLYTRKAEDYEIPQQKPNRVYDRETKQIVDVDQATATDVSGLRIPEEKPVPVSDIGKKTFNIQQDIKNGFITPGQVEQAAQGATSDEEMTNYLKIISNYNKASSEYVKVRDSWGRVQASVDDPSPAGDLSLIFNFMKMLDPNSVVRESEFATAENAGSVPERIRAQYNKVLQGERLSDKMRNDFSSRAAKLYAQQLAQQKKTEEQHKKQTEKFGLDPDKIEWDLYYVGNQAKEPEALGKARKQEPDALGQAATPPPATELSPGEEYLKNLGL